MFALVKATFYNTMQCRFGDIVILKLLAILIWKLARNRCSYNNNDFLQFDF
jgi:hypothetical protein